MPDDRAALGLAQFDLNLLTVFEAIMQERNVSRAAKRLGLSQPAASHALARLRIMLKDDVLVRGPDGMVPTERAEQLAVPVRDALASLAIALEPQAVQPEEMSRAFTITVNGYTAYVLTCRIAAALRAAAPRVRLTILPSGTRDVLDELDTGLIDLALAGMADGGDRFKCSQVMTDSYVAVMRRGHPAAGTALQAEDLAKVEHLTVTSTGDSTSFVEDILEARQLKRNVVLSLPFLAAPEALAGSDLVAVMPARVARQLARSWELTACPFAHNTPQIELYMTWHRRSDNHPEHRWVRRTIRTCLRDIAAA